MSRGFTRKLIDGQGTQWAIEIPHDVDPESLEDILVAAREGIIKLQGYRIAGEDWKLPMDNSPINNGGKAFSFYKKMTVEGIPKEEFSATMQHLVDESRKINKVRITEYEGKPVLEDSRGYYQTWTVPCRICNKPIQGSRRLSVSDGHITRAQGFEPFDKNVVRYRPSSRLRVCGDCAPKAIEVPQPEVPVQEEVTPPPKVERVDPLDLLAKLSAPDSDVDPVYFKGLAHGVLVSRRR